MKFAPVVENKANYTRRFEAVKYVIIFGYNQFPDTGKLDDFQEHQSAAQV
jgi:hypothetical protein